MVSFTAVGSCVIDANQAGNVEFSPRLRCSRSSRLLGAPRPSCSLRPLLLERWWAGRDWTRRRRRVALSGNAVILSIDASATSVCSITSGVVSFTGRVRVSLTPIRPATSTTTRPPRCSRPSRLVRAPRPSCSLRPLRSGRWWAGPTYTPTAIGRRVRQPGGVVDRRLGHECPGHLDLQAGCVAFTGAGSCVIDANQAGNVNYNPAAQVQQTVPVGKGAQTIVFTSAAPTGAVVGGPTYTPTASGGGSGNAVIFSIDASATYCCLDHKRSGHLSLGRVRVSLTPTRPATSTTTRPPRCSRPSRLVRAPRPSCSLRPPRLERWWAGQLHADGVGWRVRQRGDLVDRRLGHECLRSRSQAGWSLSLGRVRVSLTPTGRNANYNPAPRSQQTVPVGKGAQTIVFTSAAPTGAVVGGPTYTPTASGGGSGNAVILSIDASATSVCSITSGVVTFTGAGSCVIDANQAGNVNCNPAAQVQQTVPVGMGAQTIVFTSAAPTGAVVGGPLTRRWRRVAGPATR